MITSMRVDVIQGEGMGHGATVQAHLFRPAVDQHGDAPAILADAADIEIGTAKIAAALHEQSGKSAQGRQGVGRGHELQLPALDDLQGIAAVLQFLGRHDGRDHDLLAEKVFLLFFSAIFFLRSGGRVSGQQPDSGRQEQEDKDKSANENGSKAHRTSRYGVTN